MGDGLQVYKNPCANCLLSPDSIVSPERRREILGKCAAEQSYFICHKATEQGEEIVCKTFYDKMGHISQMVRIAERLNVLTFVEQPPAERYLSFNDINNKTKRHAKGARKDRP